MKITIEGQEHELNVEAALAAKVLTPIVRYRVGQKLFQSWNSETYMLCGTGQKGVILINLSNGRHWDDAAKVEDIENITAEEFAQISNNDTGFSLVK